MFTNSRPVIILAGFSCAGKTTICSSLIEVYNFEPMEQYLIYNTLSRNKGYQRTRHWLNAVGRDAFVQETTLETVRRINALAANQGAIIDASYGPLMSDILRSALTNTRLIIIAVEACQSLRETRMAGRLASSDQEANVELNFRDDFLRKVGVERVMATADFAVTNTGSIESVVRDITACLTNFQVPLL